MPIRVTCPSCKKTITAPDSRACTTGKCPGCSGPIVIPSADPFEEMIASELAGEKQFARIESRSHVTSEPREERVPKGLVECPDCHESLSKTAKTCPHCGAPGPAEKEAAKFAMGCTAVGCLLPMAFFVLAVASCVFTYEPTPWQQQDNWSMAYIQVENAVRRQLKSPGSAKFPGVFDGIEGHVTRLTDHGYEIRSYVDSQNGFGALMRTHYHAIIQQIGEDEWKLHSLNFK